MPTKAEKLLAKGKSLESKGRRDKALDIYRDACRADPHDPDVWLARGDAAKAQGLVGEAAESFFHSCELYARGGLPEEALKAVKRVLEIDANHGGAKRLRRVLQEKAGVGPDQEPAPGNGTAVEQNQPAARSRSPSPSPSQLPLPLQSPAPAPAPAMTAAVTGAVAALLSDSPLPPPRGSTHPPPTPVDAQEGSGGEVFEIEAIEPSRPMVFPPPPPTMRAPHSPGPSGPLLRDPGNGTADTALDSLSLADRLESSGASAPPGSAEIALEEVGQIDVVQAVASTLTTSPLLAELDSDLVRHLIDVGKLVHRGAEELVCRQGDLGTSLYLILSGEVSVVWEGKRERRELARLRAGAFFGEMALLTNTGRSASVIAIKNSDFLEVSRRSVRELVDREPRVLKLLLRFFRARLIGTLLQTSPLFKPFSRQERHDLIGRFRLRELAADHQVITEGAATDGLFVVLVGKLEVLQAFKASHRKKEGDGLSVLLGTLSSGDVFGEMSLLDGTAATASVRSRTRAWVLLLPRGDYVEVVERHPQIREHLEQVASERRNRNQVASDEGLREDRLEPV